MFEGVEAGRFPADHWRAIEENGLADVLLPEAAGGAGVDFGDAMAVARGGRGRSPCRCPWWRRSSVVGCLPMRDSNPRRGRWGW